MDVYPVAIVKNPIFFSRDRFQTTNRSKSHENERGRIPETVITYAYDSIVSAHIKESYTSGDHKYTYFFISSRGKGGRTPERYGVREAQYYYLENFLNVLTCIIIAKIKKKVTNRR